ncbi:hypothetical protein ACHAXT_010668 [Thalassiosira profunda]
MASDIQNQLAAYGSFLTTTLRPRLQAAVAAREETEGEISEYAALRGKLLQIEQDLDSASDPPTKEMNALVDLAHGAVYCNAAIPNPRTVYVNVGFGFHVEMTLPEAVAFIDRRIDYLDKDVLTHRSEAAAAIAKDVERALELLEEAGGELKEADRGDEQAGVAQGFPTVSVPENGMPNDDLVPREYWISRGHDELYALEMDNLQRQMKSVISKLRLRPRESTLDVELSPREGRDGALLHDDVLMPLWKDFSDAISTVDDSVYDYFTLFIDNVQLSRPVLELLAPALLNQPLLTELCLRNNLVPRDCLHIISKLVESNPELDVFAFCNPIESDFSSASESGFGATSLAQAVKNHSCIDTLSFNHAGLGRRPMLMESMIPAMYNPYLKTVALSHNEMKTAGAALISDYLSSNPPLEELYLKNNHLGDRSVRLLSESLKLNTNLELLDLRNNSFGEAGELALCLSVYNQCSLNDLYESNHTCHLRFNFRLVPFSPPLTKEGQRVLLNGNDGSPRDRRKAKILHFIAPASFSEFFQLLPYLLAFFQDKDENMSLTRLYRTMSNNVPWLFNRMRNNAQRYAKRKRKAPSAPAIGMRRSSRIRRIN